MSVEGGYLISRFTIFAMRNSEGPLIFYLFVGWGTIVIIVRLLCTSARSSAYRLRKRLNWPKGLAI